MTNNRWYHPAVFEQAAGLTRFLGREGARALADGLGRLPDRLATAPCEAAASNLRQVRGVQGEALARLVRTNLRGFLRTMADYAWAAEAHPEEVATILAPARGAEHLEAAVRMGGGTLLVTGHLGHWELGALHLASRLRELTVVTLAEPTPELTAWRAAYRARFGVRTVVVGESPFAFVDLVKTLERGGTVAMLVDRPFQGASGDVDFCGGRARFSTGPATLWRLTGVRVLPVFMLEESDGRYRPHALPPVEFEAGDDKVGGGLENTQRLATAFEPVIRKHAEQWYQYVRIFGEDWTGGGSHGQVGG